LNGLRLRWPSELAHPFVDSNRLAIGRDGDGPGSILDGLI
jgi:hypothetical protein